MPALVVVQAPNVTTPAVADGISRMTDAALATRQMGGPVVVSVSTDRTVATVTISLAGNGTDRRSERALATLRHTIIPATIGSVPAAHTYVGGATAGSRDFNDTMKSRAPIVFVFVLSAAFLLLLFTFRSLVIPIEAIVLNLLSVGAAYGVLVWIFQYGHLESFLDFKPLTPRLGSIRVPTMILNGELDFLTPRALHDALRTHIPDSALVIIPNAYHAFTLEKAALTADLLARFATDVLAKQWSGGGAVRIAPDEPGGEIVAFPADYDHLRAIPVRKLTP